MEGDYLLAEEWDEIAQVKSETSIEIWYEERTMRPVKRKTILKRKFKNSDNFKKFYQAYKYP